MSHVYSHVTALRTLTIFILRCFWKRWICIRCIQFVFSLWIMHVFGIRLHHFLALLAGIFLNALVIRWCFCWAMALFKENLFTYIDLIAGKKYSIVEFKTKQMLVYITSWREGRASCQRASRNYNPVDNWRETVYLRYFQSVCLWNKYLYSITTLHTQD